MFPDLANGILQSRAERIPMSRGCHRACDRLVRLLGLPDGTECVPARLVRGGGPAPQGADAHPLAAAARISQSRNPCRFVRSIGNPERLRQIGFAFETC